MGVTRFALSPEDGLANLTPMFAEFAARAVLIVYQDTPMFVAESCAFANLIGGCPGKANCRFESMDMVSSHGERVLALDYHCRTIALHQGPFCLSRRLNDLRGAGPCRCGPTSSTARPARSQLRPRGAVISRADQVRQTARPAAV